MALKDRQRATHKPVVHGAPCSIGETYRSSLGDTEELDELHTTLYVDGLNNMQVVEEFKAGGYVVSRTAASKHRAGHCRCFNVDKDFCPTCKRHLAAHGNCEEAA